MSGERMRGVELPVCMNSVYMNFLWMSGSQKNAFESNVASIESKKVFNALNKLYS